MITTPTTGILPQAWAALTANISSQHLSDSNHSSLCEETSEFLLKTLIGGRLKVPVLGEHKDRLEAQTLAVRALRWRLTPGAVADRLWIRFLMKYGV